MAYNSYITSTNRNTSLGVTTDVKSTYTNELREYFKEGRTIKAEHLLKLQTAINAISAHTHNYTDYYMIGVFGDGSIRSDATRSINRTTTTSRKSDGTALSSNNFYTTEVRRGVGIQDTHFNLLKDKINDLRNHSHRYTDYFNQDAL